MTNSETVTDLREAIKAALPESMCRVVTMSDGYPSAVILDRDDVVELMLPVIRAEVARARVDELREASKLRHGVDLNPTTMGNADQMWWYSYLQNLDAAWRDRLNYRASLIEKE